MSDVTEPPKEQYGALPFRRRDDGSIEVLLVTSRKTGRWIIPKGWPAPSMKPFELAAREAMEEGGVLGQIDRQPLGHYRHKKRLGDGSVAHCKVDVFAMEVESQMPTWPESDQRKAEWFLLAAAAANVREPELKALIISLESLIRRHAERPK